jgi:hypothetical protein
MSNNGHRPRVPPLNLKYEEAQALLKAKEGFGWPPGSPPWMAFEAARSKVARALDKTADPNPEPEKEDE